MTFLDVAGVTAYVIDTGIRTSHKAKRASADELAERWTAEATEGIDASGVWPGF